MIKIRPEIRRSDSASVCDNSAWGATGAGHLELLQQEALPQLLASFRRGGHRGGEEARAAAAGLSAISRAGPALRPLVLAALRCSGMIRPDACPCGQRLPPMPACLATSTTAPLISLVMPMRRRIDGRGFLRLNLCKGCEGSCLDAL